MKLFFTIYGEAVAKARARTFTNKHTGKIVTFTPSRTRAWEETIKLQAISQMQPGMPVEDAPLVLDVIFYRSYPKSMSRKKRLTALPIQRPDTDNLLKSVKDALNGIIWRDDSQITTCHAAKRYDDRARVEITVQEDRLT